MAGIVYLTQPFSLVTESRFKISSTKMPMSISIHQKNTRYLCMMECVDRKRAERAVKKLFKKKYTQIDESHFEGDEDDMIQMFVLAIISNNKIVPTSSPDIGDHPLTEMFPDYESDVVYGGSKQLIKIIDGCDSVVVYYITIEGELGGFQSTELYTDFPLCIDKLTAHNVIEYGKTYDLLNQDFTKRLNYYKSKRCAHLSEKMTKRFDDYCDAFENDEINTTIVNIIKYLFTNCRLNGAYVIEGAGYNYMLDQFQTASCVHYPNARLHLFEYNRNLFDVDSLFEELPYIIEYIDYEKFYVLNKKHEYIGLDEEPTHDKSKTKQALIKDWDYKKIDNMRKQYDKLTRGMKCINPSYCMQFILQR